MLEGEVARRTLRMGALFCSAAAGLFSLLYALSGPAEFVLPHIIVAAILAIIAAIPVRDPTGSAYLAITAGLLLFGYQLVLLGRIDNGITVWFLVPIIAATMLGMRRLTIYCSAVTAAEIIGVVAAARFGGLRGEVVVPNADLVMVLSIFSVATLSALFAFLAQRARERLILEVGARNAALEDALEQTRLARNQAIEAAQDKDRFLANLTHEIRTPLNGIAGTAELLQHTALSAEQRPLAKALGASTQNLVELVNAMLDHAKMSAGHVRIERAPVQLQNLAQNLRDLFGAHAADKRLAYRVTVADDAPAWIETDGIKLQQIVGNLVSNAIKFTDSGSVVVNMHCAIAAGAGDARRLVVEVTDTGVGIAPEQIKLVFDPFVQGDTAIDRAYGGTGLGLAIARQLAELLGGTLSVDSRPGTGSTFTLEVPVTLADAPPQAADAPPAMVAGPRAAESGAAEFRVLLAEDNSVNQLVACAMLERLQAQAEVAQDGIEAVDMAGKGDYQVILMDLQMPGMDGIAAAREIRRREQLAGKQPVPIIAMTGNSPDDYGDACIKAGMSGYIMKPVSLEQLRGILAGVREAR
ncbi:MAG: response regulator [Burkholderiales bacterium]|nr:response regulator [Burkholderiales bacterium]